MKHPPHGPILDLYCSRSFGDISALARVQAGAEGLRHVIFFSRCCNKCVSEPVSFVLSPLLFVPPRATRKCGLRVAPPPPPTRYCNSMTIGQAGFSVPLARRGYWSGIRGCLYTDFGVGLFPAGARLNHKYADRMIYSSRLDRDGARARGGRGCLVSADRVLAPYGRSRARRHQRRQSAVLCFWQSMSALGSIPPQPGLLFGCEQTCHAFARLVVFAVFRETSCRPNCSWRTDASGALSVVAVEDVPPDSQLFIS